MTGEWYRSGEWWGPINPYINPYRLPLSDVMPLYPVVQPPWPYATLLEWQTGQEGHLVEDSKPEL